MLKLPGGGGAPSGLAGARLPPRPCKRPRLSPDAGTCLARVHSNSHLVAAAVEAAGQASEAHHLPRLASVPAGGSGAPADPVDTPSAHPQQPQPACSDQSNVRGATEGHGTDADVQQQEHGRSRPQPQQRRYSQREQGASEPALVLVAADAAAVEELEQARQQAGAATPRKQQQNQQNRAAARHEKHPAAAAGASSRKRKAGAAFAGGQPAAPQSGASKGSKQRPPGAAAAEAAASPAVSDGSGGGGRRSRSATPGAQRRKPAAGSCAATATGTSSGASKPSELVHRIVEVPGAIFFVDIPGQMYVGRVNKVEAGRRVPSVEVQFRDDGSKYWFPVEDVRAWMADMCRRGTWQAHNPGLAPPAAAEVPSPANEADAKAAAEALQSLSASQTVSLPVGQAASVDGGGGGADAHPAVSSRQQRLDAAAATAAAAAGQVSGRSGRGELQRCGSELKRAGALDIMAVAAGLGPNSPTG